MASFQKFKCISIFLLGFIAASCSKDDDATPEPEPASASPLLTLAFDTYFDGAPLGFIQREVNAQGNTFEMWNMKFYISNIRLQTDTGYIDVSDVEILDLRRDIRSLTFEIPEGSYTAVVFDLGVPQNLNGTANPDFLASIYNPLHPLSEGNGMYWGWQTGYRFMIFEGRYDTIPQPEGDLPESFAFHTGQDTLFRELAPFQKSFVGALNGRIDFAFAIDVDRIFASGQDAIDLRFDQNFHGSFQQLDLGIRLADNSAASFRLLP